MEYSGIRFTLMAELDASSDLYDLAFVLFALGWYFRATGGRYVPDV
jgi:mannose/cellobiose epimerase-like protein (N-acyl-D-glucosamine 2-epimerase family)